MNKCDHGGQPWYECDCRFQYAETSLEQPSPLIQVAGTTSDSTARPPVEYVTIAITRSVFDWFLDGKWYDATPNEYHDPLLHISDRCRAAKP